VIATATNKVTATIAVGGSPGGVVVTPDGSEVYVANNADSTVSVIDTATNTVIGAPIPVGLFPEGVAITPDGSKSTSRTVRTTPARYRCSTRRPTQ
jgi:YVTN family beta-propeller protein